MDWCYHGTVDETLAILNDHGQVVSRPGAIGPQIDPALTTRWCRSTTSTRSNARWTTAT